MYICHENITDVDVPVVFHQLPGDVATLELLVIRRLHAVASDVHFCVIFPISLSTVSVRGRRRGVRHAR